MTEIPTGTKKDKEVEIPQVQVGDRSGRDILDAILFDGIEGELKLRVTEVEALKEAIVAMPDKDPAYLSEEDLPKLESLVYKGFYDEEVDVNPVLKVKFRTVTQKQMVEEITKNLHEAYQVNAKYGDDTAAREELVRAVVGVTFDKTGYTEFKPDDDYKAAREWLCETIPLSLYDAIMRKYSAFVNKTRLIVESDIVKKS